MKASEPTSELTPHAGLNNSTETFATQLMLGLKKHIEEKVSDLSGLTRLTGREKNNRAISMQLVGQVALVNEDDMDSIDDKVRIVMNELKNPADLLDLLKKAQKSE